VRLPADDPLRAARRDGKVTLGAFIAMPCSIGAEILAAAGFDWLCIDAQHGMIDAAQTVTILQAIGARPVTALVRVPANDPAAIGWALDAGAAGVIVPSIENRDDARRAIAATRYPPAGIRSVGPTRARIRFGPDYVDRADDLAQCIVMIESVRAMGELEAIVAEPGIAAVFVGPADLALSIDGLACRPGDPRVRAYVARAARVCAANGIPCGVFAEGADGAADYASLGVRMLAVGLDTEYLRTAAARALEIARCATE